MSCLQLSILNSTCLHGDQSPWLWTDGCADILPPLLINKLRGNSELTHDPSTLITHLQLQHRIGCHKAALVCDIYHILRLCYSFCMGIGEESLFLFLCFFLLIVDPAVDSGSHQIFLCGVLGPGCMSLCLVCYITSVNVSLSWRWFYPLTSPGIRPWLLLEGLQALCQYVN